MDGCTSYSSNRESSGAASRTDTTQQSTVVDLYLKMSFGGPGNLWFSNNTTYNSNDPSTFWQVGISVHFAPTVMTYRLLQFYENIWWCKENISCERRNVTSLTAIFPKFIK